MTLKTKIAASVKFDAPSPKEYPEITGMTAEQLIERIRVSINDFYRQGLYSPHLATLARAAVLLSEMEQTCVAGGPLIEAVHDLYYAAVWHPDRPVDATALWTAVRDAAGFEPGQSPAPSEEYEVLLVPKKHAPAMMATLNYLVQAG
jgi:hypothetical protein